MPEFGRPNLVEEEILAAERQRANELAEKRTYSLTPESASTLAALAAELAMGNASLLLDVAVKHFAKLDEYQQRALVSIELANRSRNGQPARRDTTPQPILRPPVSLD